MIWIAQEMQDTLTKEHMEAQPWTPKLKATPVS